jgi:hypothetical protein
MERSDNPLYWHRSGVYCCNDIIIVFEPRREQSARDKINGGWTTRKAASHQPASRTSNRLAPPPSRVSHPLVTCIVVLCLLPRIVSVRSTIPSDFLPVAAYHIRSNSRPPRFVSSYTCHSFSAYHQHRRLNNLQEHTNPCVRRSALNIGPDSTPGSLQ